eukprot:1456502-Pyramimonas_sp.AAC.1
MVGDFSMSHKDLATCGHIEKVGGVVFTSEVEHTCITGTGASHIDFVLASKTAAPYVIGLTAILDAPWGTHCGHQLRLRSEGLQLIARSLVPPRKLPQVQRP